MEKNTGKKVVTQGKLRENTGNFISAGMWPPCCVLQVYDMDNIMGLVQSENIEVPV